MISNILGSPETTLPQILMDNGNWTSFLGTWLAQANKKGVNTLGYNLKPTTSLPQTDATFVPHWNTYQMSPWRDENGNAKSGLDAGASNALVYLQLLAEPNASFEQHYVYTGNLLGYAETGSLYVAKKLFWNQFLLPKLRILSYMTYMKATYAHCDNDEMDPCWEWQWQIGENAAQGSAGLKELDPFYDWQVSPDGLSWTFEHENKEKCDRGAWGAYVECYIDCEYIYYAG